MPGMKHPRNMILNLLATSCLLFPVSGALAAEPLALATAFAFAAFGMHIYSGGAYEPRTVIAMSLRTLVWVTIAAIAWRRLARRLA